MIGEKEKTDRKRIKEESKER
jgi:hypothetical protein